MKKLNIGFAICGSFCTFELIFDVMQKLIDDGHNILPIFTFNTASTDTRFGTAKDFAKKIEQLTGKKPIDSLVGAEPIGPKGLVDIVVVAPCTGNTLSKIANAITDGPVTMVVKAHLRNNKPVVIGISSNDSMGINFKNLGSLYNQKNIYFVPFGQDDFEKKPNSLISDYTKIPETIEKALLGEQLQPVLLK